MSWYLVEVQCAVLALQLSAPGSGLVRGVRLRRLREVFAVGVERERSGEGLDARDGGLGFGHGQGVG